jgi:hypothetical protein
MPSAGRAAAKREGPDPIGEIGRYVVLCPNHIQMVVIPPARLRASAAEEAGSWPEAKGPSGQNFSAFA